MDGVGLILQERERQKLEEGWTPAHDDEHTGGELAIAAACYAVAGAGLGDVEVVRVGESFNVDGGHVTYADAWPWSKEWDKRRRHDRVRRLQIAGALIAAEIDRELRRQERRKR